MFATSTPYATATAIAPLLPLRFDTFDSLDTAFWISESGWTLVGDGAGYALAAADSGARLRSVNLFNDVEVEARVRFASTDSALAIEVRSSAAGSYRLHWDASGTLTLLRAGQQVSSALVVPAIAADHRVRLAAVGGMVRAAIDGVEVIAFSDSAPLPAGAIGFETQFTVTADNSPRYILLDDIGVRVSSAEFYALTPTLVPTATPTSDLEATAEVTAEFTSEVTPRDLSAPLSACIVTVYPEARAEPPSGFDTGIDLTAGQRVTFSPSGVWDYGTPNGGKVVSAWGDNWYHPGMVLPSARVAELIGTVGSGYFRIGAGRTMIMPASGRLRLLLNDLPGGYGDNSLALTVSIDLCSPAPTATATGTFPPPGICDLVLSVPANKDLPGFDTGIDVVPGDTLILTASGEWDYGTENGGAIVPPSGTGSPHGSAVLPSASLASLIGTTGGSWFAVGNGTTVAIASSGRLRLMLNDVPGAFYDNAGAVSVSIRRCVPTATPTLPYCPESGQGESAQSAPLCQVVTPTPTATDPIASCSSTDVVQLEAVLSAFGITIVPTSTVPATATATSTPTPDGRINWTSTELQQICLAATRMGQAFLVQTGRSVTPQVIFKEVMGVEEGGAPDQGDIELIRVNNRANCITDNNYRTITCGNLVDLQGNPRAITEYVIVHEFGHVFDNQADRGNARALREYIADTGLDLAPPITGVHTNGPILDVDGNVVMGAVVQCGDTDNWLRGERGWGSGPGSLYNPNTDFCNPRTPVFTNFQQNTAPYGSTVQANEETAADMFLNWVYRKMALGGFLNRDWRPHVNDPVSGTSCNSISEGCDNTPAGSGDTRFNWMQTVMNEIFAARSWNT